ncbi:hypothetical protein BKH43_00330 [Helicobacter sp. 13S00401-1]|uniref:hypothetical protein n=1 Tax=Helicobacter sp. 13S00401-1 TaxID=1905758 RepID=UPI000BA51142|nr:hypothetical protein [Helicobacter sp. 13S00401-1]PAF51723.1 hypothetical protein BKH43_00330 [Helicobacter sp. 13S00401-1]
MLKNILARHAKEIFVSLIESKSNFALVCSIDKTSFDPELPTDISENFGPLTMFILAGFTFESIELGSEYMSFEAGFGPKNIGSVVSLPYHSVHQILLPSDENRGELVLFINPFSLDEEEVSEPKSTEEDLLERSKNAILSNPKNLNLKK